jgi:hypothetical protein
MEVCNMKKDLLIFMLLAVALAVLAGCAPTTTGTPLVTVFGKIADGNYILDQAAFDANSVELTYNDPWMGDGLNYKGILLSKLVELVKPKSDATIISLIATDGKALDIPLAAGTRYSVMLARWVDGTLMDEKNGGPVKVAFPDEAKGTDPIFADENWAWWIVSIELK